MRKITLAALLVSVEWGAGGITFQSSNERHNVTNIGKTPATCVVTGWQGATT